MRIFEYWSCLTSDTTSISVSRNQYFCSVPGALAGNRNEENKKGRPFCGRPFQRRKFSVLWLGLVLLLLLLHALFLLLHHDIEFFLLVVIQGGADLVNGAFANGADFLDLLIARH
jgi:hypothetical protein